MRFCDVYLEGFRSNEVETKRKEEQSTKQITTAIKLGEMRYKILLNIPIQNLTFRNRIVLNTSYLRLEM